MAQHFLLSAQARTLSAVAVARLTEEEARALFGKIRWHETDGDPVCPRCGCHACYAYASRPIFKCKGCQHQFSLTSGTIFASHKLPLRDYLMAIALFVNAAKGMSALQLSRDLQVQYKTAFVLAHKLREALGADQAELELQGEIELDGAYFGGHVRQENRKADRKDRRLAENRSAKRKVVVVMRQRGGRTVPLVFRREDEAVGTVMSRVAPHSTIYADEARGWDSLHGRFDVKRINHGVSFAEGDVSTNQAESYFSRLRRAEWGQHHHMGQQYLGSYAAEMAWREDHRRVSNGGLFVLTAAAAAHHPVSRTWAGYWQRRREKEGLYNE